MQMFFATPHFITDSSWREFALLALEMNSPAPGVRPTKRMLNAIQTNITSLSEITENFRPL